MTSPSLDQSTPRRRIVIASTGTRGDVQPFCVLGQALARFGHDVVIATEKRMEAFVTLEYGLGFRCLLDNIGETVYDPALCDVFRSGNILSMMRAVNAWKACHWDDKAVLAAYEMALCDADIVVTTMTTAYESYCVAEKTGAIWVPVFLGLVTLPTGDFSFFTMSGLPTFGLRAIKKWTHALVWRQVWQEKAATINPWRQTTLQLPPIQGSNGLVQLIEENAAITFYQACSLLLFGAKGTFPSDYVPGKVVYTGFLFPDPTPTSSDALKAFLKQDDDIPVIYVGFGSMPTMTPSALLHLLVHVCRTAKCRCVFVTGWSSVDTHECQALIQANTDVLCVESQVCHAWLFPQMRCIVHHAGVGTTAAAMRSGVPQVPCPVIFDQFANAAEIVALGVAPCVIPNSKLSATAVSHAVEKVLRNHDNIRAKAASVAETVQQESHEAVNRLCRAILSTPPTFAAAERA
ncbi:Aste57867_18002 [Aphanomyces stellatus]|uniref:Aste57867_18002 protein n=1 Tax=Aphanomyces stellatus TaxID=120398 RepID=A0A485L9K6_9STRA|nr:hypothetical protein As57867_017940 [Aphanomyces stellatus]VFT94741.1 Aste57867_18002 [Aphanomyces stellatus]